MHRLETLQLNWLSVGSRTATKQNQDHCYIFQGRLVCSSLLWLLHNLHCIVVLVDRGHILLRKSNHTMALLVAMNKPPIQLAYRGDYHLSPYITAVIRASLHICCQYNVVSFFIRALVEVTLPSLIILIYKVFVFIILSFVLFLDFFPVGYITCTYSKMSV